MREFIKKVSWVTIANATALIVSALITVLLPKYVSVTEYGYWQMYLLFVTYIGCIHLGLPDGIYLRYSGKDYHDVACNEIKILFWISSLFEIGMGIVVYFVTYSYFAHHISLFFAICTGIYVPSLYLKYIILASNMMKQYSIYVLCEKIVSIISIFIGITCFPVVLHNFIIVDVIGKTVAFIYALVVCRENFKFHRQRLLEVWSECKKNITAGICLMISTVSSNFIVGIIRIFIIIRWSIEDFGKVSLSLQISNFVLAFVRAISLPLFPVVKRLGKTNAIKIYENLRLILITLIFGMIMMYFPLAIILEKWLPDYSESIHYLGILFPICLFEAKQALLCETYLKNYRKERILLFINVGTMLISLGISSIIIFGFSNQSGAIYLILCILCFRSIISEVYLNRFMNRKIAIELAVEIVLIFLFVMGNTYLDYSLSALLYALAYLGFIWINQKGYLQIIKNIKESR